MVKYSPDNPINTSEKDLFGREDYAKKISNILLNKSIKVSYVIGLYSPWGYGKTSLLGMVEEKIGEKAIIVKFNPWAYTDQASMARGLLVQLTSEVATYLPDEKIVRGKFNTFLHKNQRLGRYIDKKTGHGALSLKDTFADLIGQYGELTGAVNSSAGKGASAVSKLVTRDSLDDIRQRVEKIIKDCGKRVVVVIDDVDRLDKDEIFQLFKLVKIITNFKGVTYLIAFDDVAVSKALKGRFSDGNDDEAGRKYIEKIIQIPLHVPLIEREVLDRYLFEGIDECLEEFKIEINQDDINRFRNVYDEHIALYIDTPRMVNRYINALKFTIPMVDSEVNMADLLLVEAIRLIFPEIYGKLRIQKKLMTGTKYTIFIDREEWKVEAKKKVDEIINNNDDLKEVLKALFPSVKKIYDGHGDNINQNDLKRLKRVASVDYYNRYFTYGVGKTDVSDSEIVNILSLEDSDDIAGELRTLLKDRPQELVMTKLKTYVKSSVKPFETANALLKVVDELSDGKEGIFGRSPLEGSTDLIAELLSNSKDRLKDYSSLLSASSNLDQLTYLIREVILGSENKEGKDPILNENDLVRFKEAAVAKIKDEAAKQLLHDARYSVSYILYQYWAEFSSKAETNDYLLSKLTNTDAILDFLTQHLAIWHGSGGSHRGDLDGATYSSVEKIVDIKPLYEVIVREHPEYLDKNEFSRMKDRDDGIGSVGTEKTSEFRNALTEQFIYQYKRSVGSDDAQSV